MAITEGDWSYCVAAGNALLGYDLIGPACGSRGQFENMDDARLCAAAPQMLQTLALLREEIRQRLIRIRAYYKSWRCFIFGRSHAREEIDELQGMLAWIDDAVHAALAMPPCD